MAKQSRGRVNIPNKRPFNHPVIEKYYFVANSDDNPDLVAALNKNQTYIWAINARPSNYGNSRAMEGIDGYEVISENTPEGLDVAEYVCIGATFCYGKKVSFWASKAWTGATPTPGIIVVDGNIRLMSDKFPIRTIHHLDISVNDTEWGGELFISDYNLPPMIFNLHDLDVDAPALYPQKYFEDFNYIYYTVNYKSPLNQLVLDGIVEGLSGSGIPRGSYVYSYRKVTTDGTASAWSFGTHIIPIPDDFRPDYIEYPGLLNPPTGNENNLYRAVRAGDADPDTRTGYGVRLKLRIDNESGDNYIEIKRTSYNTGAGLGYTPNSHIIQRIDISDGQFEVITIIDNLENQTEFTPVAFEDETTVTSIIKRAMTVRYVKNKLVLGNIEYESRDLSQTVSLIPRGSYDKDFYTISKAMNNSGITDDTVGYTDPMSCALYKSYQDLEEYGIGVVVWDSNFTRSFLVPLGNIIIDHRRKELSAIEKKLSSDRSGITTEFSIIEQCDVDNNLTKDIHHPSYITELRKRFTEVAGPELSNIREGEFNPRQPYSTAFEGDSTDRFSNNSSCNPVTTPLLRESALILDIDEESYEDFYTASAYRAIGIAITGLENFPSWANAFSIVRPKRAGKVICQGLAFYDIDPAVADEFSGALEKLSWKKSKRNIILSFPDIEASVVNPSFIDNLIADPSSYKIAVVEPLHVFFQPIWSERWDGGGQALTSFKVDGFCETWSEELSPIISPAISPYLYQVCEFGKSLNTYSAVPPPAWSTTPGEMGNKLFEIEDAVLVLDNEENKVLIKVTLTEDFYSYDLRDTEVNFNSNAKDFMEPVYVVNVIKEGATIPSIQGTKYYSTGNFVKINSRIGISTGDPTTLYYSCDERKEDYHGFATEENAFGNIIRTFIFVGNDGLQLRYVNANGLLGASRTAMEDDVINGTTLFCGERIYGWYYSTEEYLYFPSEPNNVIPDAGIDIIVSYDNRKPISVFGGDVYMTENMAPIIHRKARTWENSDPVYNIQGNPNDTEVLLGGGFPLYAFGRNIEQSKILRSDNDTIVTYVNTNNVWTCLMYIRQMIVKYRCNTFINPMFNNQNHFPRITYIDRPWKYTAGASLASNHVDEEYDDVYGPEEKDRWNLGGIRLLDYLLLNLDYTVSNEIDISFRAPLTFKPELNIFYNRVAWSLTRPIQNYDAPNLRTFLPFNVIDISDRFGQITKLFDNLSGGGDNIYAFTDGGIFMLLAQKVTLSSADGNLLAQSALGDSTFISQYINLSSEGLQERFRFSFAEENERVFYVNNRGIWMFSGNKIVSILENNTTQYNALILFFEDGDSPNYRMTGAYIHKRNEYFICIPQVKTSGETPVDTDYEWKILVYSAEDSVKSLIAEFTYPIQRFISDSKKEFFGIGNYLYPGIIEMLIENGSYLFELPDDEFVEIPVQIEDAAHGDDGVFFDKDFSQISVRATKALSVATMNGAITELTLRRSGYEALLKRSAAGGVRNVGGYLRYTLLSISPIVISGAILTYKPLK